MEALPKSILRIGWERHPAEAKALRAGPFTLLFELHTGFLRHLRLGDHEALRAIYGAVRDPNWDTIPPAISRFKIEARNDSFAVKFHAVCRQPPGEGRELVWFVWEARITGGSDGRVTCEFNGEAKSTFRRNRIGLCVLHPLMECAGKWCRVEHVDGSVSEGTFPRHIAPHQPFRQMRAITCEPAPGQKVEVRFGGEVFEMEDQRNWTDASFKSYGTPLDLPFPVLVKAGARIHQVVQVAPVGPSRKILPVVQGRGAQLSISTTPVAALPPIGLMLASPARPLSDRERDRFKALRLSHLRVDLHLATNEWEERLREAAIQAQALDVTLHAALFINDAAERQLDALAEAVADIRPKVSLWLIFHEAEKVTDERWVRLARQKLSSPDSGALLAAGTNASFAELNRNRPPPDSIALPCYSISPQVHAFDELTLVENLSAQAATVETALEFCPRSVVVTPITLRPRFNPHAASRLPAGGIDMRQLLAAVDVRQLSLFGAGWTLGSLANLSLAGNVHSLTYYETVSSRGVMEREEGSPLGSEFRSIPGGVFPLYHVFADIAGYRRVYPTTSSHPLQAGGMTLIDDQNRRRVLVANFLNEVQQVRIKTGTCRAQVRYLDETNAETAMRDPEQFRLDPGQLQESISAKIELNLKPCALARVDILP